MTKFISVYPEVLREKSRVGRCELLQEDDGRDVTELEGRVWSLQSFGVFIFKLMHSADFKSLEEATASTITSCKNSVLWFAKNKINTFTVSFGRTFV